MNPISIRIFEVNSGQVVTQFLDICTSISEALYTVVDGRLSELLESANPWEVCTSVGVDNTSINIGIQNSLRTKILKRNNSMGVPATAYIMLLKKLEVCGFDVEEFTIPFITGLTNQQNETVALNLSLSSVIRLSSSHKTCVYMLAKLRGYY